MFLQNIIVLMMLLGISVEYGSMTNQLLDNNGSMVFLF